MLVPAALLATALTACNPPGQLEPLVDAIDELPGMPEPGSCAADDPDCCLTEGWCLDVEWLTLRNVGGSTVNISSVSFTGTDASSFTDVAASLSEVSPNALVAVSFRYTSPGGAAQSATLVVESDGTNPTLEIPVQTLAYEAPPPPQDAGPGDAGPGDAGPSDAGPTDAGPTDAGPTDAGPTDAGPTDAGPTDGGAGNG